VRYKNNEESGAVGSFVEKKWGFLSSLESEKVEVGRGRSVPQGGSFFLGKSFDREERRAQCRGKRKGDFKYSNEGNGRTDKRGNICLGWSEGVWSYGRGGT